MASNNRRIILLLIQVIVIKNAILMGWKVRRLDDNSFELTKKVIDVNIDDLMEQILRG